MHVVGRRVIRSRASQQRRIDTVFALGIRTFLVAALLYGDLAWIAMQPHFQIEEIAVVGTHAVDPGALEMIAHDHLAEKFLPALSYRSELFAPTEAIAATVLAQYPRVATARVEAREKMVRVSVEEYGPAYLWCGPGEPNEPPALTNISASEISDGGEVSEMPTSTQLAVEQPIPDTCLFADRHGYLFSEAPAYAGTPFVRFFTMPTSTALDGVAFIEGDVRAAIGSAMLGSDEFTRVTEFLAHLRTHTGLSPRSIRALGGGDYEIATEKTWAVLWASELSPEESVERLTRALTAIESDHTSEEPVRVVDLRFGNKIFYR